MRENIFAAMGLICADCSHFERESEDGDGTCLTSAGFDKVNARDGVCNAFTRRGCEVVDEKEAIANLRNQYLQKGVSVWRNQFAK